MDSTWFESKGSDIMKEDEQIKFDKLDIALDEKVRTRLKEIVDTNEIIKFDFIGGNISQRQQINSASSFQTLFIYHDRY